MDVRSANDAFDIIIYNSNGIILLVVYSSFGVLICNVDYASGK
ncbi:hypothetical protein [Anaerococcus sp. AGMB09787]|nr:hypothetical protein [Anaerococcus sp. AGMB09787]